MFYINRPIDINWLLNNRRNLNRHSFYNFSWNFFNNFNWNFLLYFYIFRNLDYFFDNSFWTRHCFYYFYNNLNRLFDNNFFDNFLWCPLHQSLYFIFSFFQHFSCHFKINWDSIVICFLFSNNSIVIIAYFWSILEILKLKVKSNSLFLRFFQLVLEFFYFFE